MRRALRNLGHTEIPVIWHNCSDEEALRILAADNRASDLATYNKPQLVALLDELQEVGGLEGSGYTKSDMEKIEAELNAMYAPPPPPGEQPPAAAKAPQERMVLLRIGTVSAKVPHDRWATWQESLYVRVGHKKGAAVDEIRRRLKL